MTFDFASDIARSLSLPMWPALLCSPRLDVLARRTPRT